MKDRILLLAQSQNWPTLSFKEGYTILSSEANWHKFLNRTFPEHHSWSYLEENYQKDLITVEQQLLEIKCQNT